MDRLYSPSHVHFVSLLLQILQVHIGTKRLGPDVDLDAIAPGSYYLRVAIGRLVMDKAGIDRMSALLDQTIAANEFLESNQQVGKVVVTL